MWSGTNATDSNSGSTTTANAAKNATAAAATAANAALSASTLPGLEFEPPVVNTNKNYHCTDSLEKCV